MGNRERLAWFGVAVLLVVLLIFSFMAYDALAQHIVTLNHAYAQCLEIQLGDE